MSKAKLEAQRLLDLHGLNKPPFDPEYIAEMQGVDVNYFVFEGDAAKVVHGYYSHDDAKPEIVVNAEDSVEEQQFTIAHELGHHILHAEYSASEGYVPRLKAHVDSAEENEADDFALSLLAPSKVVRHYAEMANDETLSELFVLSPEMISKAKALCD